MNTGNDLADACFYASLFTEFCDIFTSFSNDDASVFCAYKSAEG